MKSDDKDLEEGKIREDIDVKPAIEKSKKSPSSTSNNSNNNQYVKPLPKKLPLFNPNKLPF